MNSVLGGIALMLLVAVVVGAGFNGYFTQSASDAFTSTNNSVRLK